MRLLVCGDRNWTDLDLMSRVLNGYQPVIDVLIHGAARGADTMAGTWARISEVITEPYPAHWDEQGKAAGPIRNQQMLDDGKPDAVIAFHDNLADSKGTGDMVRRAKRAGLPVYVVGHG